MTATLRSDALAIWQAAVRAVDSERLVRQAVRRNVDQLQIAGQTIDLRGVRRILVVGGGKAGAGMAAGLEAALGHDLVAQRVEGIVNVPADCVRPLTKITLHAGRPAGVNEPTEEGVAGVERMLALAATMTEGDVCVVLLSGGGSALLPAPAEGITLADKQAVTRWLMSHGASIEELNAVRGSLSRIKQGGLVRVMPAGRCLALIISDVIGDPLPVIASGPTVNVPVDAQFALGVLRRRAPRRSDVPECVWQRLEERAAHALPAAPLGAQVQNAIIGNNRTALDAAAAEAERLGYAIAGQETDQRGEAREVGRLLAERCLALRSRECPRRGWYWLSGGEPVVHMAATTEPRRGGRNQELVLAALDALRQDGAEGIALLSGGTDGEDGPTDAAGAVCDAEVVQKSRDLQLDPAPFLAINNSYPFFAATGGLLKTGPTHTNVMDVRVALVTPDRDYSG
jgi:hydroxypyruvate reductase